MKDDERLKEIEAWHLRHKPYVPVQYKDYEDVEWLIARVKRLTEALEELKSWIADKALEEE